MFRSCYVPYRRTEDDIEENHRRSKVDEAQMSPNRQTESMFSEDFCGRNWVGLPKTNSSSPNAKRVLPKKWINSRIRDVDSRTFNT
ncbi:hypothetical protein TIFTF001_018061 [Ficus carica]|uniref:Uncharacterized protein n=1 Tax=Ficus carica TaxID=3494 RepID=A0AA88D7K2_FICCA|nr:hypothetical protein TIFTF001_018061 [Ficus carica]